MAKFEQGAHFVNSQKLNNKMSKILGIDLGTTNSAMAAVINGEPKIIEN